MSENKKGLKVLALAMGLPTSILGVAFFVYYLIENKIVSNEIGLLIILAVIFNTFFLIFKALK